MGAAPVSRTGTVAGRLAAVLATTSVCLHLASIGSMELGWAVAMVALATVCAGCAGRLWVSSSTRSWAMMAVWSATMIAIHLAMHHGLPGLPLPTGHSADGESGALTMAGMDGADSHGLGLMHTAVSIACVELWLASFVLIRRVRPRTVAVVDRA